MNFAEKRIYVYFLQFIVNFTNYLVTHMSGIITTCQINFVQLVDKPHMLFIQVCRVLEAKIYITSFNKIAKLTG